MLSYEYHGLLENPGETLKQNAQSLSMLRALLFPISKEEVEIRNNALSGIWNEIKTSIDTNLINGDPYTASRFVTDLGLNIASLFVGVGEIKAAAGVKKADNVVDGLRAIDKVSDVKKLSNGELWFNYFNKSYGAGNVEWTSKVFEGNVALKERVFANIEMSRLARESSNYRFRFKEGFYFEHMTGPVEKFTEKGGVSGGHNYNEFVKFFQNSDKYQIEEIARRNSHIDGIFEIEYKAKVEKKDFKGNATGEYKVLPKGTRNFNKTVYDSSKISDDEIVRLSKEAMKNGIKNKNIEKLRFQPNKVKVKGETIFNGQKIKFEGYRNVVTNEIENAYPVLP